MATPFAENHFRIRKLHAKRTAASACGLHLWIIELETRTFHRFHVIHHCAVQVQHARLVDEHLQAIIAICFVEHVRRILEGHRVTEPGTPTADHRYAQPSRLRFLPVEDLLYLGNRCVAKIDHVNFFLRYVPIRYQYTKFIRYGAPSSIGVERECIGFERHE
jgi:hypothetical protein